MIDICQTGQMIPDLYGLGHVAGWKQYNLRGLAQVGYVLHRSCTVSRNGRSGYKTI